MRFVTVHLRLLGTLGPDRRLALLIAAANLGLAGLLFVEPILFGRVIGLLSNADRIDPTSFWHRGATLLGIWIVIGTAGVAASLIVALNSERLAHRNRLLVMHRFFDHVIALPAAFHGKRHSGLLMKTMLGGSEATFGALLTFFRDQLATLIITLVLLPLTLLMNWRLALALIGLVIVFVALAWMAINRSEAGQRRAEGCLSELAGRSQDALSNVAVVQSFSRLAAESRAFGDLVQRVIQHQFPVLTWWAAVNVLARTAGTMVVMLIVVVGTWLHMHGQAGVGEIVAFMGFANLLIGRLDTTVTVTSQMFFRTPRLEAYFDVLDTGSTVPERPHAPALVAEAGEVVFDNVTFAYPGGEPILQHLNFVARPGTVVALVGRTGAGKSTAMALLQRLWDPIGGSIRIDGQDLRDVSVDSLRDDIGVVFQESMLFNRSIRENLLVGRPEASDAEIEHACKLADAHDFIAHQPQGYDTLVGERGATLSGGQRQRLAIARALLKDPPILILDEATSALDSATEARVGRALKTLMAERTTFVIAHRLSTVRDADEILVFDNGRIVERGRFERLLARGGVFASLVGNQLADVPQELAAN